MENRAFLDVIVALNYFIIFVKGIREKFIRQNVESAKKMK